MFTFIIHRCERVELAGWFFRAKRFRSHLLTTILFLALRGQYLVAEGWNPDNQSISPTNEAAFFIKWECKGANQEIQKYVVKFWLSDALNLAEIWRVDDNNRPVQSSWIDLQCVFVIPLVGYDFAIVGTCPVAQPEGKPAMDDEPAKRYIVVGIKSNGIEEKPLVDVSIRESNFVRGDLLKILSAATVGAHIVGATDGGRFNPQLVPKAVLAYIELEARERRVQQLEEEAGFSMGGFRDDPQFSNVPNYPRNDSGSSLGRFQSRISNLVQGRCRSGREFIRKLKSGELKPAPFTGPDWMRDDWHKDQLEMDRVTIDARHGDYGHGYGTNGYGSDNSLGLH